MFILSYDINMSFIQKDNNKAVLKYNQDFRFSCFDKEQRLSYISLMDEAWQAHFEADKDYFSPHKNKEMFFLEPKLPPHFLHLMNKIKPTFSALKTKNSLFKQYLCPR